MASTKHLEDAAVGSRCHLWARTLLAIAILLSAICVVSLLARALGGLFPALQEAVNVIAVVGLAGLMIKLIEPFVQNRRRVAQEKTDKNSIPGE